VVGTALHSTRWPVAIQQLAQQEPPLESGLGTPSPLEALVVKRLGLADLEVGATGEGQSDD
jgi:hypothetical protein